MLPKFIILIIATTLLLSCADSADSPKQVAEKYWSAVQNGNAETASQLSAKNTTHKPDSHIKKFMEQQISHVDIGEEKTTVTTTLNSKSPTNENKSTFQTSLVFEDNQWKVDLDNTKIPDKKSSDNELNEMADKLSESMKNNAASLDQLLKDGTNLLNDALRDGSKEMNETMIDAMNKLNNQIKKSIDNIKKRREQKQTPKEKPESGEGLI